MGGESGSLTSLDCTSARSDGLGGCKINAQNNQKLNCTKLKGGRNPENIKTIMHLGLLTGYERRFWREGRALRMACISSTLSEGDGGVGARRADSIVERSCFGDTIFSDWIKRAGRKPPIWELDWMEEWMLGREKWVRSLRARLNRRGGGRGFVKPWPLTKTQSPHSSALRAGEGGTEDAQRACYSSESIFFCFLFLLFWG